MDSEDLPIIGTKLYLDYENGECEIDPGTGRFTFIGPATIKEYNPENPEHILSETFSPDVCVTMVLPPNIIAAILDGPM